MGGAPSVVLPPPTALLLGGADVLEDEDFFRSHNICGVVSLGQATLSPQMQRARALEAAHQGRRFDVLHLAGVKDSPDAKLSEHFARVVEFVFKQREQGGAVYIHCQAGISRSTTCVCAFLMTYLYPAGLDEVLGHVHRCRETVCPNEGFRAQLLEWEQSVGPGSAREELYQKMRERFPAQFEAHSDSTATCSVRSRDLSFIADTLMAAEAKATQLRNARWIFVCDGTPVGPELEDQIQRDGEADDTMSFLLCEEDGEVRRRRVVRSDADNVGAVPFGLVGFEQQKAKLRKLLAGKESQVGGSMGLEWLMET